MIISAMYFVCFAVLLFNTDRGIRVMSAFGITHILCENGLYWWFSEHIQYYDWNLYLTGCWFLDIGLLFSSACVLQGWRKKNHAGCIGSRSVLTDDRATIPGSVASSILIRCRIIIPHTDGDGDLMCNIQGLHNCRVA